MDDRYDIGKNVLTGAAAAERLRFERIQKEQFEQTSQPLDAEKLKLRDFIKEGWRILQPTREHIANWHIDAICDHLEAVLLGQIRNLLINIPPRHQKSLTVSVFWPAHVWTDLPAFRFLCSSYSQGLSTRDSVNSRRVIESSWYQAQWGNRFQLTTDQNQKTRYENDKTGYRISTSVGGSALGEGGDCLIADDPHNLKDKDSDLIRQGVLDWYDQIWSTRLNDPKTSRKIVIMQRCHEKDISGHLLEQGGYVHLCLPSEYEPDRKCSTVIGWEDPRKEPGELLNPKRFGIAEIEEAKKMGARDYAGIHQQRPTSLTGNIFKRHWWRFWHFPDKPLQPVSVQLSDGQIFMCESRPLPKEFDELIQSWDMTFKDTKHSDMVAGQVWARKDANRYLLDNVADRMDFTASVKAVLRLSDKWPQAQRKLIEDKANGPAIITTLKDKVIGLLPVDPAGGKIARAYASTPAIESGNVYLPHPKLYHWVGKLIDRTAGFPASDFDDEIDAMTQALNMFAGKRGLVFA